MYRFNVIFRKSKQEIIEEAQLKLRKLLNGVNDGGGQQCVSLQTIFSSPNGLEIAMLKVMYELKTATVSLVLELLL